VTPKQSNPESQNLPEKPISQKARIKTQKIPTKIHMKPHQSYPKSTSQQCIHITMLLKNSLGIRDVCE